MLPGECISEITVELTFLMLFYILDEDVSHMVLIYILNRLHKGNSKWKFIHTPELCLNDATGMS